MSAPEKEFPALLQLERDVRDQLHKHRVPRPEYIAYLEEISKIQTEMNDLIRKFESGTLHARAYERQRDELRKKRPHRRPGYGHAKFISPIATEMRKGIIDEALSLLSAAYQKEPAKVRDRMLARFVPENANELRMKWSQLNKVEAAKLG